MKSKLVLALLVLVIALIVGGTYYGIPAATNNGGQNAFTLTLVIANESSPNSTISGQYIFFVEENGNLLNSAVINVPMGRLVRVVIINHDPGTDQLLLSNSNAVAGVLKDQVQLFESTSVSTSKLISGSDSNGYSQFSENDVSHTFTTSSGLNIPIIPHSTEVAYTYFNTPGTINWGCMCSCGQLAMSTPGWMGGELIVSPP